MDPTDIIGDELTDAAVSLAAGALSRHFHKPKQELAAKEWGEEHGFSFRLGQSPHGANKKTRSALGLKDPSEAEAAQHNVVVDGDGAEIPAQDLPLFQLDAGKGHTGASIIRDSSAYFIETGEVAGAHGWVLGFRVVWKGDPLVPDKLARIEQTNAVSGLSSDASLATDWAASLVRMPSGWPNLLIRRRVTGHAGEHLDSTVHGDVVRFESEEFNGRWSVRCTDARFATALVDAEMMQFLLDLQDMDRCGFVITDGWAGFGVPDLWKPPGPESFSAVLATFEGFLGHVPPVVSDLFPLQGDAETGSDGLPARWRPGLGSTR